MSLFLLVVLYWLIYSSGTVTCDIPWYISVIFILWIIGEVITVIYKSLVFIATLID